MVASKKQAVRERERETEKEKDREEEKKLSSSARFVAQMRERERETHCNTFNDMQTSLLPLLVSACIAALLCLLLARIKVFQGWCGNTAVKGIGR